MLKPGGTLAAWCYNFPEIEHHSEANAVLSDFIENVVGPHKTEGNFRCERQYRGIEPGREDFGVMERDSMSFEQDSTVWHLVSSRAVSFSVSITGILLILSILSSSSSKLQHSNTDSYSCR